MTKGRGADCCDVSVVSMSEVVIDEDIDDDIELVDDELGVGDKFSISSDVRMVAVTSATLGIEVVINDFGLSRAAPPPPPPPPPTIFSVLKLRRTPKAGAAKGLDCCCCCCCCCCCDCCRSCCCSSANCTFFVVPSRFSALVVFEAFFIPEVKPEVTSSPAVSFTAVVVVAAAAASFSDFNDEERSSVTRRVMTAAPILGFLVDDAIVV